MDESDEYATVETIDDGIIETSPLRRNGMEPNKTGESSFVDLFMNFVSANGWYIIIASILLYMLWKQKVQPLLVGALTDQSRSSNGVHLKSAEDVLARQEAVEMARQKLQQQYDIKAQEFAVKQKEKEEKLRQQKLQELEKYGPALGCTNRTKVANSTEETEEVLKKQKANQSKFRPEYNPLMGGSNSMGFRPARRSAGGGGWG